MPNWALITQNCDNTIKIMKLKKFESHSANCQADSSNFRYDIELVFIHRNWSHIHYRIIFIFLFWLSDFFFHDLIIRRVCVLVSFLIAEIISAEDLKLKSFLKIDTIFICLQLFIVFCALFAEFGWECKFQRMCPQSLELRNSTAHTPTMLIWIQIPIPIGKMLIFSAANISNVVKFWTTNLFQSAC